MPLLSCRTLFLRYEEDIFENNQLVFIKQPQHRHDPIIVQVYLLFSNPYCEILLLSSTSHAIILFNRQVLSKLSAKDHKYIADNVPSAGAWGVGENIADPDYYSFAVGVRATTSDWTNAYQVQDCVTRFTESQFHSVCQLNL